MFNVARVDDMLRNYGDKEVAAAQRIADLAGEPLLPFSTDLARHRGECRAWAAHDSFFIWEKPLSNGFDELKAFVTADAPPEAVNAVQDWQTLHAAAERRAVGWLGRMTNPCPAMLAMEQETYWWQLMAVMHECDRQLGRDLQLGK